MLFATSGMFELGIYITALLGFVALAHAELNVYLVLWREGGIDPNSS